MAIQLGDLKIGDFRAVRGMQLLKQAMDFAPAALGQLQMMNAKGLSLGDFIDHVRLKGGQVDAQKLLSCCEQAENEYQSLRKQGVEVTTILDPAYPTTLKGVESPPGILYSRGNLSLLKNISVAVVGSRKVAERDAIIAEKVAIQLCRQGFVVSSGLAMGIDTAAHIGALKANGKTIGVMPGGLDWAHRWNKAPLVGRILEADGLIVTPFSMLMPVQKETLLYRNLVIIGISVGTLVVKADVFGGTMNSAFRTINAGRPLAVVADQAWASEGAAPAEGYGGGFSLVKRPRREFTKIPVAYPDAQKQRDLMPDRPFAFGVWGQHDMPRLYDTMRSAAGQFADLAMIKFRDKSSGAFQVVEADTGEIEPKTGVGRSLRRYNTYPLAGDEDPFATEEASSPFSSRRRPMGP